ncbi:MAG: response regulator transcription factor [Chloroflexi bacterium]|nr:response regulator transcription factor [Chloroflexota bacterium]
MNSQKPNALIIEDDAKQAEIFSQALTLGGFDVLVINDGSDAVSALDTLTPDLVLLDLHLPSVSGEKLLKQIRASSHLSNTKVIVATASPEKVYQLDDESDLVLIKPISFNQLRELAERLLQ